MSEIEPSSFVHTTEIPRVAIGLCVAGIPCQSSAWIPLSVHSIDCSLSVTSTRRTDSTRWSNEPKVDSCIETTRSRPSAVFCPNVTCASSPRSGTSPRKPSVANACAYSCGMARSFAVARARPASTGSGRLNDAQSTGGGEGLGVDSEHASSVSPSAIPRRSFIDADRARRRLRARKSPSSSW